MDDAIGFLVAAAAFVFVIFAIVSLGTIAAAASVPAAIGYAIYWQQVKSPTARERRAKERTIALYKGVRSKFRAVNIPAFLEERIEFDADAENADIQLHIAKELVAFENLNDYAPRGTLRGTVAVPIRTKDGMLVGYIGITEAKLPPRWNV